ncbi:MAG: aspartate carbamoyltransferase catalytic subunit [Candidatus Omnitrophica bacterium]|jgi:aspartate carbamoyltransferase catalytic subunit|nr:aspartate carbamoyltransferase catalytic subunit [Candidatus Omnitrophota bacterium]MDD5310213.1 aspartate carbamoyltransferase catalytic subunit [Candidatus Omnitrophota bacterium]MDD5546209.1 aspartate carbamoyltransferase catalytic subunit [Candidatus Omnitrophota bacterium]
MAVKWTKKDLLGLESLSADEIGLILETADSFKEISQRPIKKVPTLRGQTVVLFFFEPSTRTRTSFELAAKRMSADIVNIQTSASSLTKGETLKDTARNIEAMKVNIIIMRHSASGAPQLLAESVSPSIINAGDGSHEHPTQGLLDIFTIKEHKKKVAGLNVSIIGDIAHSRVARSNIWGLTKLGAKVTVCGPATLMPPEIEKLGVKVTYDIKEAIEGADVINMLRIQLERQGQSLFPSIREYAMKFGLDAEKLRYAKKDVLIMHPGPINRGVEITPEVADGPYSVILEQVTNGIAVRMAVLYLVSGVKERIE